MSRTPGLILAVVTGVVGIGAIWAFSSFLRPPAQAPRATDSSVGKVGPAPVDLSSPPPRIGSGNGTRIQGSSGAIVQWADKNDPSRLAGEMRYATLEPLGDKRYNVTSPKGWMFMRDGGAVYLEAKAGNVFIADEQVSRRPDSGTLTGGVVVNVFKRKPDGSRPDPAQDVPYATTTMDTLSFDGTTGEISTPDPILATLETATFAGRGLTVIFNELKDRVEYLEIREGDRLVIRSAASQPASGKSASEHADARKVSPSTPATHPSPTAPVTPLAAASPTGPQPSAGTVDTITRTQYRAVFGTDVRLSQGTREIKSEQLEVFAVLINGRFSPEAFGSAAKPASSSAPATPTKPDVLPDAAALPTSTSGNSGKDPVAATASPTAPSPVPGTDDKADVILTWVGPLVARTVDDSIAELVKDDVTMRFTSPMGGLVHMDDPSSGAKGTAPVLNYFATRREIAMSGGHDAQDPQTHQVTLDLKESGTVIGHALALNLSTGVAHARGSGQIVGLAPPLQPAATDQTNPAPGAANGSVTGSGAGSGSDSVPVESGAAKTQQTIAWSDQADFIFAVKEGKVSNQIQEAILSGKVQARGDGSALDAGWLRAVFASAEKASHVTLLEAKESVQAADASGATLSAQDLRVAFTLSADGQSIPERVIARTNARATRGKDIIEGNVIDARVGVDETGKSQVKVLTARESAHVQSADGVDARAYEITFDVPSQRARLTGRGTADAVASKDSTTITGPVVEVDGVARTIGVPGPGTLTHVQAALPDGFVPRVDARWNTSMTFDDLQGTAQIAGSVTAVWTPDAVSTDKVTGQQVAITLAPAAASTTIPSTAFVAPSGANSPAATEAKPKAAREVLRAVSTGDAATPATVESRRVASSTDRTLVTLTYVQGAVIEADNVAQTFTVPGAGKLLSVDRSQTRAAAANSSDPFAQSRGQGDALFTWSDSMIAYRNEDRAQMRGDVQVVHLRSGDPEPTELRSRELTATLRTKNATGNAAGSGASPSLTNQSSLSKLIASGNVWARSSTKREMTSDRMIYDAEQGVMILTADNDRDVTVFDPAARAPLTSKAIEWDLKKDRVRVIAPGSISTGR
jgi:lipopolysaccharide export system protein LptA